MRGRNDGLTVDARTAPEASGRDGAVRMLWLLLAAPVVVHVVGMGLAIWFDRRIPFGLLDIGVLAVVLAYVGIGSALICRRPLILRFLVLAYSVILAGLCGELLARCVAVDGRGLPHRPGQRVKVAADTMPGIEGRIEFTINSMGVRGREVDLGEVDLRILCVGGSTTESLYVTDRRSWPWRLEEILAERTGLSVFVGNAGVDGQFSLHHDHMLRNYRWVPSYQFAVILCGINDMGTLLRDNYEERARGAPEEALTQNQPSGGGVYYRRFRLAQMLESLMRSTAQGVIVQDDAGEWYRKVRQDRQELLRRNAVSTMPDVRTALLIYRKNLQTIIESCRARDVKPLFLTQPTMYRSDLPDDLENLLWGQAASTTAYTTEVLTRVMDLYNETMIGVCQEQGVDCLDLASLLPKDTSAFYDDCHFNLAGSERVAQILGEYLLDKIGNAAMEEGGARRVP